jgi:hypothetical protein
MGLLDNIANTLDNIIFNPIGDVLGGVASVAGSDAIHDPLGRGRAQEEANVASLSTQLGSGDDPSQMLLQALSSLTGGEKVPTKPEAPVGFQAKKKDEPIRRILEALLLLKDLDEDAFASDPKGAE